MWEDEASSYRLVSEVCDGTVGKVVSLKTPAKELPEIFLTNISKLDGSLFCAH